MWIILVVIGILFVDYAVLRASHLKNDSIADDKQQIYEYKRNQEEDRTEL